MNANTVKLTLLPATITRLKKACALTGLTESAMVDQALHQGLELACQAQADLLRDKMEQLKNCNLDEDVQLAPPSAPAPQSTPRGRRRASAAPAANPDAPRRGRKPGSKNKSKDGPAARSGTPANPDAPRRGRKPGSKNKPKGASSVQPMITDNPTI